MRNYIDIGVGHCRQHPFGLRLFIKLVAGMDASDNKIKLAQSAVVDIDRPVVFDVCLAAFQYSETFIFFV